MPFDEQSISDGSFVNEDGQPADTHTNYDLAPSSSRPVESGRPVENEVSPRPGGLRRVSSGMHSVLMEITDGQLRPIELELAAQRRVALGESFECQESDQLKEGDVPKGEFSRRDAIVRSDCNYGMDAVGNHVADVMKWIADVHKAKDDAGENNRTGFKFLHPLSNPLENCVKDNIFPGCVEITGSLEMALAGLNSCLYEAEQKRLEEERMREESDGISIKEHLGDVDRIVAAVSRISSRMKTVILIADDDDRSFVLSNPVIRRAMLSHYSVISTESAFENSRSRYRGRSWLLELLKSSDRDLTDKAIDYLELLSSLSVNDYVSIRQPPTFVRQNKISPQNERLASRRPSYPSKKDEEDFGLLRDSLFKTVGSLNLLIPHLFKLYTPDIERVSTLPVIRRALDDAI
eukprot:CAMPEP_0113592034 /NCGR_PEP_ID=MMETSP0015_2-20120614/37614_1 /TAXON_ID=2838 /ORGANISM="Odontella" /LENGTH=405 /DNA_ID=CAMNT_0000498509 /DNA_START=102 /DNA_END=1316 /DNA_ORIENTATION=- /assembly_acc=CAM_ASM_000160